MKLDTPRDGKAWCDTVNSAPMPTQPTHSVIAVGTCNSDGSGYRPYDKPIERQVQDRRIDTYLRRGDSRL